MQLDRQAKPPQMSLEKVTAFFNEVIMELKKTTWPTWPQALRLTYVVIAITVVVALYMAGLNFVLDGLVSRLTSG